MEAGTTIISRGCGRLPTTSKSSLPREAASYLWTTARGDGRAGTPVVAGRTAIPFLECDGAYNGRPENDEVAIRELSRMLHESHPSLLIIIWPAFWWLDYYTGFANHLKESFRCVLSTDSMIVFDLQA